MSLSAGTVTLGVKPDTAGFGSDLKSKLLGSTEGVGKGMGSMILGGLKTMAGPIAAVGAAFSIKHVLEDSMHAFEDAAGNVRQMQRVAGGTVEQVSGLSGAMQLAGVETNKISGIMTIFSKNIGKAGADAGKTAEMNKLFGQSIKDAHGNVKPMAELLPGLADHFKAMPDGAQKTALAMQLFGRQGAAMLPALNKGSAGIQELTDKAKKMGLVLDQTSMNSFAESKKSAREFDAAIQGVKVSLGGDLLPVVDAVENIFRNALAPVLNTVAGFLRTHRELFMKLADTISGFGKTASGSLGGFFKSIGASFQKLAPVFTSLVPQVWELLHAFSPLGLVFKALAPMLPDLIKLIVDLAVNLGQTLGSVLKQILPPITQVAKLLVGVMSDAFKELLPLVMLLAKTIGGELSEIMKALAPIVVMLVQAIASLIPPLTPIISQIIKLVIDALTPLIQAVLPIVKVLLPIFTGLLKFLIPIITFLAGVIEKVLVFAIQLVIGYINGVISVIKGIINWFGSLGQAAGVISKTFQSVFSAIGGFIKNAFNGVVSFVKGIMNGLIDIVNGAIDGLNSVGSAAKNLTGGAIGFTIDHIPHLANGGIVPATPGGRLVRVAEAGQSEAVIPLDKLNGLTPYSRAESRPIMADGVGLIGWVKETAQGEAKLVFNSELSKVMRGAR
jgi:phage-related protein